jgi:hypothetical protein
MVTADAASTPAMRRHCMHGVRNPSCPGAERTPTAVTILSLLNGLQREPSPLHFDHLAFRTFGVSLRLHAHAAVLGTSYASKFMH